MKAKQKAIDLVMKFQYLVTGWDCFDDEDIELIDRLIDMKRCALICVDEILVDCYEIRESYWLEVKQEIKKL
jgi:hypothetical protein|tara:strand:+ start:26 stop:241 length:216 start_codon:yes stop_codon:yes gene_type:complete